MPVPVPSVSKPPAHSVQKCNKAGDSLKAQSSVFQNLKRTLPLSPTGPPPSFGSREQWINSLPSWRRTKTRHIWEDDSRPSAAAEGQEQGFRPGLAGAVNASAIKGAHVQACIPPLSTLLQNCGLEMASQKAHPFQVPDFDIDQEMGADHSHNLQAHCEHWGQASPMDDVEQDLVESDVTDAHRWSQTSDLYLEDDAGAFAPILEDDSPYMISGDTGSSPIEPLTPFGDYVDRAVATSDDTVVYDPLAPNRPQDLQFPYAAHCGAQCYPQCYHLQVYPQVEAKEEPVIAAPEPPPTATLTYKKLAEPMAEWIVSYVWKVCTNAIMLPQQIASYTPSTAPQLRQPAPLHLTSAVHSLLMSTLLQPSAILLALWYITRLPVYFGAPGLGPEHVKERRFRVELLGDTRNNVDGESLEGTATFRLIVLGCMLANKWLDDHTFSNKTWHTISNVPVQSLNKLEYFALDIFSHDLSISPSAWTQWLNHLLSYNHSLSAVAYPQPISRPSSNPNSVIRKTIQDIMEAPLAHFSNEPVFLGVEQRRKEKLGLGGHGEDSESLDIDLDEDGPLREEYLPKRHVSNGSSTRRQSSEISNVPRVDAVLSQHSHHPLSNQVNVALPPPSKWSPAGDEPIYRQSNRIGALYIPVQPTLAPHYVGPATAMYPAWPAPSMPYVPLKHGPEGDYVRAALPMPQYPYWRPANRSRVAQPPQPYCTSDYYGAPNHGRAYSHGGFDNRCSDTHVASDGAGYHTQPTASWTPLEQYNYAASRQPLGPHPPLNYQSTWLRA
ncbi:hypothetical protein HYDPIDRAFT_23451 [Hydnomerulius pinastri MD-312]|nr:hypothetical protein HYDPIDRAFT_23451 [Hydnomerulius pinastri MD-312]